MMAKRYPFSSNSAAVIVAFLLLLLLDLNQVVQSQTRNEPVNCNWIIALPWDVANSLRAPLGGPVSLVLSGFLACILLFGLLLSPVNYIFGWPPRIYHPSRKPGIFGRSFTIEGGNYSQYQSTDNHGRFDMADVLFHLFDELLTRIVFDKEENYMFEGNFTGRELAIRDEYEAPGFLESVFLLVPEEDEICRQLMLCHAHGFLGFFPPTVIRLYQWLSKHYITIPPNYKTAILIGLKNQGECGKVYADCSKDLFHLVRGTLGVIRRKIIRFLPTGTVDIWQYFYSSWE